MPSTFGIQPKQETDELGMGADFLGGLTTGAMTAGLPGAIVGGVVGIGKAIADWYAMKKQNEEIDRVNNLQMSMYREETAKKDKADQWLREQENKKIANQKKIDEYNKIHNFMANFQSILAQQPNLQTNLINAWNARGR